MMKIYLLLLIAIIVTCQANEVSRSRQLNANSSLRRNDLNKGAYLDAGNGRSDRIIGRTAYDRSVYVVRKNGLNDDRRRAGNLFREASTRSPYNPVLEKLPSKTNQASNGWNRAGFSDAPTDGRVVRRTRSLPLGVNGVYPAMHSNRVNNVGQVANILRNSDLNRARNYDQENYLSREGGLTQTDYARRNLGLPVVRAENYLNYLNGIGRAFNVERTSYLDRLTPIMKAGSNGQKNYYVNNAGSQRADVERSESINVILSKSDSSEPPVQMNRHGFNYLDPVIKQKQQNEYVPSILDTAERSAIKDSTNDDHVSTSTPNKDLNVPNFDPNDEYSLLTDTYENSNDGYDVPHDGNRIHDDSDISNQSPTNGYGGMDYNMLAPDFDSFRDTDVNIVSKIKIVNSPLITANNDSTVSNNNNNNTQNISDRGGFFDDDDGYTLDHRGFHNTGTMFSDDSTKNDGSPDFVEINSNIAPMNSNNDCYCTTTNGHRVCNCDQNHQCEGANCNRVTTQTHATTTTTCELCKVRETTTQKPFVCDICAHATPPRPSPPTPPPPPPSPPPPPPRCECPCETCKPKCDPCKQRESSCECKQTCSCGCNCCKHSGSSCCKHSSSSCCEHSCPCKQRKPSCNSCESGQNSNYGDNGYSYSGDHGNNHHGDNVNNYYDEANKVYTEYYNDYLKKLGMYGGNAGGQLHTNVQGGAYAAYGGGRAAYGGEGATYGGGGAYNTGRDQSESSGSIGGTVAIYVDTDLEDPPIPISSSKTSNTDSSSDASSSAASSKSSSTASTKSSSIVISKASSGGSKSKSSGSSSVISSGSSSVMSSGVSSYKSGGSKSSTIHSSSTYGSNNPYSKLFSSFSKTRIFPKDPMMGPGGMFGGLHNF